MANSTGMWARNSLLLQRRSPRMQNIILEVDVLQQIRLQRYQRLKQRPTILAHPVLERIPIGNLPHLFQGPFAVGVLMFHLVNGLLLNRHIEKVAVRLLSLFFV